MRKNINDYSKEVAKEINQYYLDKGLIINFTDKDINKIMTFFFKKMYKHMVKTHDIHIINYFKLFSSKKQIIQYYYMRYGKPMISPTRSFLQQYKDFFNNNKNKKP